MEVDLSEILRLMQVSAVLYMWTYCVLLCTTGFESIHIGLLITTWKSYKSCILFCFLLFCFSFCFCFCFFFLIMTLEAYFIVLRFRNEHDWRISMSWCLCVWKVAMRERVGLTIMITWCVYINFVDTRERESMKIMIRCVHKS